MADVAAELSGYLAALDGDPGRLTQLLERQAALRALTRRYGEDVDAVRDWARSAVQELTELDCSEDRLAQRQRVLDEAHSVPIDHGWGLAGPDGVDQVEFVMVAHPGAPELPIAKGASGGELSRVMLALEVVLADADPVATMVFDEVDAGVGGRAASEIGSRLAALSRSHQVIVVTHLAQVAAYADRHYVVDASSGGRIGTSDVRPVTGDDREVELARMLGGTDGASARAHARDLLGSASRPLRAVRSSRPRAK